jgi:hypothetical protein
VSGCVVSETDCNAFFLFQNIAPENDCPALAMDLVVLATDAVVTCLVVSIYCVWVAIDAWVIVSLATATFAALDFF